MKKIIMLSGLFLMLLFIGCQNDINNPVTPVDNTETPDKLNKRALELFAKGVDAADAAKTLDNEFTDENKILLKALYKAGYKAAALTKAAHVTFNYNSRSAENILDYVVGDNTQSDLAELILIEYAVDLKLSPDDLIYFFNKVQTITKQVTILKEYYEKPPFEVYSLLEGLGENVMEIIKTISNQYYLNSDEAAKFMISAGFSADDITTVLKETFSFTYEQVASILIKNNFKAGVVLNAVKNVYKLSLTQIGELLQKLGYNAQDAVDILKNLFIECKDIAKVLKDTYKTSPEEALQYLKNANFPDFDILISLKELYQLTCSQIAGLFDKLNYNSDKAATMLKQLNFNWNDLAEVLFDHYKNSYSSVASTLNNLKASTTEIAKALHEGLNLDVLNIAVILKDVNFSLLDIAGMLDELKDYFEITLDKIIEILIQIGFDRCDVLKIFKLPCF